MTLQHIQTYQWNTQFFRHPQSLSALVLKNRVKSDSGLVQVPFPLIPV